MSINHNEIRLLINVVNGLIESVYGNSAASIKVAIQDFSVEGCDGDEIATLPDGMEFVGHIQSVYQNSLRVSETFSALGEAVKIPDPAEERYLAHSGNHCPNCGSTAIHSESHVEIDGMTGCQEVMCDNCDASWKDQYLLVGISDFHATPLVVIASLSERGYFSTQLGWVSDVYSATKYPANTDALLPISAGSDATFVDLASAEDFLSTSIDVGDEVFWNDPDQGLSSGIYTVDAIHTESGKLLHGSDICFIKNGAGSEAEVFAHELA